ncbi:MAG: peptide ABC transporter substrate-binding protein, partial [Anaerolineaceae bacterium]|nr:peptide ABC transporter substrate-binding protein [Anaerolineaceae bacterium]
MKHLKLLFALLVLASLLLAACGGAVPATQAPATEAAVTEAPATEVPAAGGDIVKGGKVIVGSPQEPGTLNPVLASASIEDAISSFIIEGLVQVDAEGKYAPVLAEALPTVSEDGLTITYNLKKGVKWANGDAFTCSDVEFTYQVIMSDLSQVSTSGYGDIDKFECVDETTVKLTMAGVYAPYLRLFSFILPKSAGDITKLDSWEYNRMPFGTGPWMIQEWKAGDSMTLVKNPNFREEGKPYLDSIIIRILPSRETGMQLLGTGEIQVLWDLVESDFPALAEMKDKGVGYGSAITGENELLLFNFGDPKEDAPADVTKTPHFALSDLKVREALELAIDKQLIVDTLLSGNVRVGTSVLPTGEFACPQDPSKYDPEAAKKLLDEAGWVPGADGIREKNGARLTLKITATSGNQVREQTEQVLADMFKQ